MRQIVAGKKNLRAGSHPENLIKTCGRVPTPTCEPVFGCACALRNE